MSTKFNPNQPFGTVQPPTNNCHFWQNGHHYDPDHNRVDFQTGKILEYAEGQKAPPIKTKSQKVAEQQVKLTAAKEQKAPEPKDDDAGAGDDDDIGDGDNVGEGDAGPSEVSENIDLIKWAKGELSGMQWFKVKKAMAAAGYDPVPANAADARTLIAAKHGLELS